MTRTRWPFLLLLGLLLVIAAVAAWDYVEVWRLDSELARMESLGEPTATRHLLALTRGEEETEASRYYRAAVALVDQESQPSNNLFYAQLRTARQSNEWPNDLLEEMRARLSRNADALAYLDKAAALEFEGFREFPPITPYSMQVLHPITEHRTNLLALEGRGDESAQSLYAALRLQRTMSYWPLGSPAREGKPAARRSNPIGLQYLTRQLQMLVSRTRPPATHLALLAEEFATLDNDDLLRYDLMWLRANSRINVDNPYWWRRSGGIGVGAFKLGESIAASVQAPLYRPFLLHRTNTLLRDYGEAIDVQAGKRWPDKLDALAAHQREWVRDQREHAESVARELALIRSARTIIAIEQYRRANAERIPENWNALSQVQPPLVDPFSGLPLKILVTGNRYVVYSIDANRRDDGGDVEFHVWQVGQPSRRGSDVGISVTPPTPNP
jgi:hypothetical protein